MDAAHRAPDSASAATLRRIEAVSTKAGMAAPREAGSPTRIKMYRLRPGFANPARQISGAISPILQRRIDLSSRAADGLVEATSGRDCPTVKIHRRIGGDRR